MSPAGTTAEAAALTAIAACQDVMHAYAELVDSGRASRVVELFTDDATFEPVPGRTVRGRHQLARVFAAREANTERRTLHIVANPVVVVDGETATGHSTFLLFILGEPRSAGVAPDALVYCADRFERGEDGRWRIADRRLQTLAGSV